MKSPHPRARFTSGTARAPTFRNRHSSRASAWRRAISSKSGGRARLVSLAIRSLPTTSALQAIKKTSPAGKFLVENGVTPEDFNSYGSRRGNDRIMTRGTFANVRIKNLMVPGVEGGYTLYFG